MLNDEINNVYDFNIFKSNSKNTDIEKAYSSRTNLERSTDWERTSATCATRPLGTPPSGPR